MMHFTFMRSPESFIFIVSSASTSLVEKAREERKVRYENGKICPSCGELKPNIDYRPIDAGSWKYSWRCDKCMRDSEYKKIESSCAYMKHVYGANSAEYYRWRELERLELL